MATAPTLIDSLPPAPDPDDSEATFDSDAFDWTAALPDWTDQANALGANVFANASEAVAAATVASGALTDSGALPWVSGATYAEGDRAYSAVADRTYRRLIAGAGTTDPIADGANWRAVTSGLRLLPPTTGTAITGAVEAHHVMTNAALCTYTLPASPQPGDEVAVTFTNALTTNMVARNGQTIMDLAEDMQVDSSGVTVRFRFIASTWRVI